MKYFAWMGVVLAGGVLATGVAAGQAGSGSSGAPAGSASPGRPGAPVSPVGGAAVPAGLRLTGPWAFHGNVSGVEWDQQCRFEQKDDKVTGTCRMSTDNKEVPITGTFDGKKVQWVQPGEYEGSPISITFTATWSDPAKMAGTVQVDPMNADGDFTGAPAVEGAR